MDSVGGGVWLSGSSSGDQFHANEHPSELQAPLPLEEEEDEEDGVDDDEDNNCSNLLLESNDEGDGDDDGDEDEKEGNQFCFDGNMDTSSFTPDDTSGLESQQQFERQQHQYEVLAAKKRKARADLLSQRDTDSPSKKPRREDFSGATFDEILEAMNLGMGRRSRKAKKKGRRKGSKNKVSPEVTRKLGDATLFYAYRQYKKARDLCFEVIRLSPNFPDPYHRLGLIYSEWGDKKKALHFYMLAAHLTPKDVSLWKILVTLCMELGNRGQLVYVLSKAIQADPDDVNLRFLRASLYVELGRYHRAAELYGEILRLCPDNLEVLQTATQLYKKCGQHNRAVTFLEDILENHPNDVDLNVVNQLASLCMEGNEHQKALEKIEHAEKVYCAGKELPLYLIVKAGICHLHLGNVKKAEDLFSSLHQATVHDLPNLIFEVGNALMSHGHYDTALKYYVMLLERDSIERSGYLHLKIAECYLALGKREHATECFYKAINGLEDSVDARLNLSALLLEENKDDEAISILSPPKEIETAVGLGSTAGKQWWLNGNINLKLSQIYKAKGMLEEFVDVIFPVVRETLFLEAVRQKIKVKKRLTKRDLFERIKVVDEKQRDDVFHGFRGVTSAWNLSRASRAKKLLKKKESLEEAKRAAALAAGVEWISDEDSDDDSPDRLPKKLPLPNLLNEAGGHSLIIDLCKGLSSLQRYWEALEIINLSLKLAPSTYGKWKEVLRTHGAEIAYNIADPARAWEYSRHVVSQRPYSSAAWNCYYKAMLKIDAGNSHSRHSKLLHSVRSKHKDAVPPILVSGHQFTMISQHQAAARDYLEAYKLMPDSPLINLCAGTALINLALGFRLQNKHQCIMQGLGFLYNNLRLCTNKQEALYNIARAYHHVGLISLAAANYEKVLAMHVKDCAIPKLPNEKPDPVDGQNPGYCDLRREAAFNLHLIYKKSGALDLARQVLKDHCSI